MKTLVAFLVALFMILALSVPSRAESTKQEADAWKNACMAEEPAADGQLQLVASAAPEGTSEAQWGTKCSTPAGWCWLVSPMPIGANCCCPVGCGVVTP